MNPYKRNKCVYSYRESAILTQSVQRGILSLYLHGINKETIVINTRMLFPLHESV